MSTWGTLDDLILPAPSGFTENLLTVGDYKVSLTGKNTRNLRNVKKVWTLTYDALSVDSYDLFYNKFKMINPIEGSFSTDSLSFTINNAELNITNEKVLFTLSNRNFIPGTNLISSVQLIITQL